MIIKCCCNRDKSKPSDLSVPLFSYRWYSVIPYTFILGFIIFLVIVLSKNSFKIFPPQLLFIPAVAWIIAAILANIIMMTRIRGYRIYTETLTNKNYLNEKLKGDWIKLYWSILNELEEHGDSQNNIQKQSADGIIKNGIAITSAILLILSYLLPNVSTTISSAAKSARIIDLVLVIIIFIISVWAFRSGIKAGIADQMYPVHRRLAAAEAKAQIEAKMPEETSIAPGITQKILKRFIKI